MIHTHLDKFAILQKQIEEVGAEEVHKLWQVRINNKWNDCSAIEVLFNNACNYRLKPTFRTLKSNIEYPEPIWIKPVENTAVFLVRITSYEYYESRWLDEICYKQGRVQATEEGAKQQLAALKNALSGGRDE